MTAVRLFRLLIFKAMREEKFLTVLSVLGIALGVGLFMGVRLATDRAVSAFEANLQGIHPYANYQVLDTAGIDFDEAAYARVRRMEDTTFPVIRSTGYLPAQHDTVDINGFDAIRMATFLGISAPRSEDTASFLREQNAVLITEAFAARHGWQRGDTFTAYVYNQAVTLKISGLLSGTALPPHTVLMHIGNFQEHFRQVGKLSRLDLVTTDAKARAIAQILPPHLTILTNEAVLRNQRAFVASFKYNLEFVSLIAVLVGVFLLYNTVSISVVKRRPQIGVLRALGTGKKAVIALFTAQGLIVGAVGSLLGILLGQFFAAFSVVAVEKTISTIDRSISISDYLVSGMDVARALALGLVVSFLAALIPALDSARVEPGESLREGTLEKRYGTRQRVLSWVGLGCIALGVLLAGVDYRYSPFDFPWLAYAGILAFILGCTFNAPVYLGIILRLLQRPAVKLFKAPGRITVNDIRGSRYRFSVALMSVAISCALIVALLTSIFSLKRSLQDWIHTYMIADVYIKPASCTSNYCFYPLTPEVEKALAGFPEVDGIGRFRALHIDFDGRKVIAGFGNTSLWAKFGDPDYLDGDEQERMSRLEAKPEVSISDYLRVKYNLEIGDTLKLTTPRGPAAFTITGSATSYSTTSGFLYLDRRWLTELWGLDDATQLTIYLKEGVDRAAFVQKLRQTLLPDHALQIIDNSELRGQILEIFNRSFALTYAIEIIAILVSLIGVVNTLMILVLEKKREISVLRYLGGSWEQIEGIIILGAGIIGLAGIGLGTLMGPFISAVITHVINKISFGWEVQMSIPVGLLALLTAILFVATLLAGMIPSRAARKLDPKAFISYE
jgi:putative ABC transport system permease protein